MIFPFILQWHLLDWPVMLARRITPHRQRREAATPSTRHSAFWTDKNRSYDLFGKRRPGSLRVCRSGKGEGPVFLIPPDGSLADLSRSCHLLPEQTKQ